MERIKVLHVLTTTAGGLGQSVLALVRQLDRERFDVTVTFGPGYPLDKRFAEEGLRVLPVRMKRGLNWANLLGFWDLYRLLHRESFDIVHAHGPVAGFLMRPAARVAGVPAIIFSLHGYPSVNDQGLLSRPLLWAAEKLTDKCTDYYVAVSDYIKQLWLQRWVASPDRVRLIHHGMDAKAIRYPCDLSEERKRLSLPPEDPVVGTAGFLEERKGIEYFIRAIPGVLEFFPGCRFLVLGDGRLRHRLERLSAQLGVSHRVKFLGWRDDAAELMGMMDVFCLPSLREPFGLVLLEAMAHAKPIAATRVGGIPEVVVDGETGLLVPPRDPLSLSKAIVYLLVHREIAREMGKRGRARLLERFTVEKMTRQYESLYCYAHSNGDRDA